MTLKGTIQAINTALEDSAYPFECFEIAKKYERNDKNTYPAIYLGSGKILDLFPTTEKKLYSFFELGNIGFSHSKNEQSTAELTLICWGQLNLIDNTKNYDFTDEILRCVVDILRGFTGFDIIASFDNIFSNYSLYETKKQLFMLPTTTFRIKFKINFYDC